jgi:iron-sulfur cluster assembly protein
MIKLTEKAGVEIKKINVDNAHLRVGCKGGGCSGFTYVMSFDTVGKTDFDDQYEFFGISVLIDKKSAILMKDTVIDFNDSDLLNRGFVFNNPTATGGCGCGVSFSV